MDRSAALRRIMVGASADDPAVERLQLQLARYPAVTPNWKLGVLDQNTALAVFAALVWLINNDVESERNVDRGVLGGLTAPDQSPDLGKIRFAIDQGQLLDFMERRADANHLSTEDTTIATVGPSGPGKQKSELGAREKGNTKALLFGGLALAVSMMFVGSRSKHSGGY